MPITIEQARMWYADADPIHDFEHVLRVYRMADRLARVEKADLQIVHASALLHDAAGSAPDAATRTSHHHHSAEFARAILEEENWEEERIRQVEHCIRAHRFRSDGEAPQSIEAKIIFDADKLDVLGAIGIARVIGYASINHQPFYAIPSQQFLTSGIKEAGEPHSAYHEYIFKLVKIKERLFTPTAREIAQDRDDYLRIYFERLEAELSGDL
ncbi:MAG: HD domain-containing protein [Anaerolineaceae bacterium]|nr:HD domain-containing protein [Anaerolineaceae bacterium]